MGLGLGLPIWDMEREERILLYPVRMSVCVHDNTTMGGIMEKDRMTCKSYRQSVS